ncbi:MAG: hypothetical protein Q4F41_18555 [Eubacteriales bacterium]|nr:hypothetical protein [Eubacteriales bacterium]
MGKERFREISASVYAWDLYDEGVENVLEQLQKRANVNSVYLVGLMHEERHPWPESTVFPHNPNRKEYQTEDSAAFWKVDRARYGRICPNVPTDFLAGTDWLEVLIREAKKRKMKVGVELSHTWVDHRRLENELSDLCQKDIFGRPLVKTHIGEKHRVPCLNHPDFQAYARNLVRELAENYEIDYLMNCMMPYPMPAQYLLTEYEENFHPMAWMQDAPLLSGCFCEACQEKAKEQGKDLQKIAGKLLEYVKKEPPLTQTNLTETEGLMENPAMYEWLQFKRASVTDFHRMLTDEVRRINPKIEQRLNLYITSHPEYAGIFGKDLAELYSSVRICCYLEHLHLPEMAEKKKKVLRKAQRSFEGCETLLSTIAVLPGSTPESIQEGIRASRACGITSLALGHYDGAEFAMLDAVGSIAETD